MLVLSLSLPPSLLLLLDKRPKWMVQSTAIQIRHNFKLYVVEYSSDDAQQIEILICERSAGHMQWSRLCCFYTMCRSTFQPHTFAVCDSLSVCARKYISIVPTWYVSISISEFDKRIADHSNSGIAGMKFVRLYNRLCILSPFLDLPISSSLSISLFLYLIDTWMDVEYVSLDWISMWVWCKMSKMRTTYAHKLGLSFEWIEKKRVTKKRKPWNRND